MIQLSHILTCLVIGGINLAFAFDLGRQSIGWRRIGGGILFAGSLLLLLVLLWPVEVPAGAGTARIVNYAAIAFLVVSIVISLAYRIRYHSDPLPAGAAEPGAPS